MILQKFTPKKILVLDNYKFYTPCKVCIVTKHEKEKYHESNRTIRAIKKGN